MGLGLILSVVVATSAVAGQLGPSAIWQAWPGWNSPIWSQHANGTDYFYERSCTSGGATSLQFDLMHHWPFVPSTGTNAQWMSCVNNSTWRSIHWANASNGVDYSIEYTKNQSSWISLTYEATWPGN